MMRSRVTVVSGISHQVRNDNNKWDLLVSFRGRGEHKESHFCMKTLHWLLDFLVEVLDGQLKCASEFRREVR